jgi:hypothetical protein
VLYEVCTLNLTTGLLWLPWYGWNLRLACLDIIVPHSNYYIYTLKQQCDCIGLYLAGGLQSLTGSRERPPRLLLPWFATPYRPSVARPLTSQPNGIPDAAQLILRLADGYCIPDDTNRCRLEQDIPPVKGWVIIVR